MPRLCCVLVLQALLPDPQSFAPPTYIPSLSSLCFLISSHLRYCSIGVFVPPLLVPPPRALPHWQIATSGLCAGNSPFAYGFAQHAAFLLFSHAGHKGSFRFCFSRPLLQTPFGSPSLSPKSSFPSGWYDWGGFFLTTFWSGAQCDGVRFPPTIKYLCI